MTACSSGAAPSPWRGTFAIGDLHNLNAHGPIIKDRGLFERVQRRTVSRGRQAKSERLLARLGVLRCGSCGSRMVINRPWLSAGVFLWP